jgi:hypothetical protein
VTGSAVVEDGFIVVVVVGLTVVVCGLFVLLVVGVRVVVVLLVVGVRVVVVVGLSVGTAFLVPVLFYIIILSITFENKILTHGQIFHYLTATCNWRAHLTVHSTTTIIVGTGGSYKFTG